MSYKYIIFDVDDTLLDYGSAFHAAEREIADYLRVEYTEEYIALSEKLGWKAWKEAGLNDTNSKDVQKNYHTYYYQYLRQHYRDLIEAYDASVSVGELVELYIRSVASSKVFMEECTLQVYKALAEKYRLVLATNGIDRIQRERMQVFLPYTYKTYISENMNTIKPAKAFFRYIIDDIGCDPKECLMVGDSLSNDMVGALDAGMGVCYYNIRNKIITDGISVNYEIKSIEDLLSILA